MAQWRVKITGIWVVGLCSPPTPPSGDLGPKCLGPMVGVAPVGRPGVDFLGVLLTFVFPLFFRCLFGSILAPVSLPTCLPKSTKIQEKSMPRCHPSSTPFFNRFLIDFYSQLRPPESQKSSPRCSESTIFQKIAFRNWHRFLIDFGANLAPFWRQKSIKILQKSIPKVIKILIDFCIDF